MRFLKDSYQRRFQYLRLSVTDACNYRCTYCLPHGYNARHRAAPDLSVTEIKRLVRTFASMGMTKVRLTGGEPTLRKDLCSIIREISEIDGVKKVALSTNGHDLERKAADYYAAGLRFLNVSIDSTNSEIFKIISGRDHAQRILGGIDAAFAAGFSWIKVNAVLMKGLNDHDLGSFIDFVRDRPICMRFIELMQTGAVGPDRFEELHVSTRSIREELSRMGWAPVEKEGDAGPATEFSHPRFVGRIGLIAPYGPSFCESCNRLRVSSQGKLQMCLFSSGQEDLRTFLQDDAHAEALQDHVLYLLREKPQSHRLHDAVVGGNQTFSAIGG